MTPPLTMPAEPGVKTKSGFISSMWEMEDNARRIAITKRAARGARKTLGGKRDVIVIEPTPPPGVQLTIPEGAPAWRKIILETAVRHNILPAEMLSQQRSAPLVIARHEAMWRMKTETTMSLPAIGRRMGGRDHTTVLHGVRKHIKRMEAQNAARSE